MLFRFLFIYVKCIIVLINCFTFKYCLVSNFIRMYFISYVPVNVSTFVFLFYFRFLLDHVRGPEAKFYQAHVHLRSVFLLAWNQQPCVPLRAHLHEIFSPFFCMPDYVPSTSYIRILRLIADLPCPVLSLRHLRLWHLTTFPSPFNVC